MKTNAAVLWESPGNFEVTELELDPPKAREVLVEYHHAGLCHSDEHLRHGDLPTPLPIVGGHEGSGIVIEIGPGVTRVEPGDHFITSWMPGCGHCRFCHMGKNNLCDNGAYILAGTMLDGTQRLHGRGVSMGSIDVVGAFSQYNVVPESCVIRIENDVPLDAAALTACGVPTGWGSAVNAADTRPGDVVVVFGTGGIGINAVQGAAFAGAGVVVAVDPVTFKRDMALKLGATHAFENAAEAHEFVMSSTRGQGADSAIVTIGVATTRIAAEAFAMVRKAGTVVITSVGHPSVELQLPMSELTFYEKRVVGSLFGSSNPYLAIPKFIELYKQGHLKLDELITGRYPLDAINDGYDDMLSGKNIRGVLDIEH
ncbi:NDMA-dependent alcohol dehydrogenase [Nocardia zapadnayensis]|uniref:NDMA-dependent alcohol dehydrogenase n=1 Tax=Nocardia rhamnosiphila TaxID=426716 RepID=UPI002246CD7E|nr:NDMA-dependent alcohol dehydrogenase [Nocardia zapadnayensis]MCX0271843.1 NDMA-dependent alcohol dehydrogenase [Nocardia zapadnayensis]